MPVSQRCTRCVLPNTFPGIQFDEMGLCNFCAESPLPTALAEKRRQLGLEMARVIQQHKGQAQYDCVVAFSGGKDSSYTLLHLVETHGLNCLAVTIDNDFIAEQAKANCKAVTRALGVDHLMYAPSTRFMANMYVTSVTEPNVHARAAIRRASKICSSCINLVNAYMIKTALQNSIFLIAGGYIGGQVPKDSAIMTLSTSRKKQMDQLSLKRYTTYFGPETFRYFGLDESLYDRTDKLTIINPMLTLTISEAEIIDQISELGWQAPPDTGKNSSNCQLNDLGIAVHQRQYDFHPYVFELSEQVRNGLMSREQALTKLEKTPSFAELSWQVEKLGLDLTKIEVTA